MVVTFENLWVRSRSLSTENVSSGKLEFHSSLVFPVMEPGSVLVIGVFDESRKDKLVGKVRVRVSGLRGNVRYDKLAPLLVGASPNEVGCVLVSHFGVVMLRITYTLVSQLGCVRCNARNSDRHADVFVQNITPSQSGATILDDNSKGCQFVNLPFA
jgi:hypothetical protein